MRAHPGLPQAVDRPHEAHHEGVGGPLVEVGGAPGLLHPALVDHHDLLGQLHRLLLVVGDEDRGHVHLVVQAAQPVAQLAAHARVQRAERLVQQQHPRLHGQRPGQRHPLALSPAELGGIAVGQAGQVDQLEQLRHPGPDLVARALAHPQAEGHVVAHRHVAEGRVVLEHQPHPPPLGRDAVHRAAGDADLAGVGLLQPGDHPQQRRLPAAAGAQQRGQRAVGHRQRHLVERRELPEALGHALHLDRHQGALRRSSRVRTPITATASAASTTAAA